MFGRVAQMGQRVVDPVANRAANRFFERIQSQLPEVSAEPSSGIRTRSRSLLRSELDGSTRR